MNGDIGLSRIEYRRVCDNMNMFSTKRYGDLSGAVSDLGDVVDEGFYPRPVDLCQEI